MKPTLNKALQYGKNQRPGGGVNLASGAEVNAHPQAEPGASEWRPQRTEGSHRQQLVTNSRKRPEATSVTTSQDGQNYGSIISIITDSIITIK